ncbi:MAG: zinc ribbon domain-containing protein [bacterium]
MALRIRCPQCRTVQRIPAGVRPVCPKCGFAGNSAAQAQAEASDVSAWAQADPAAGPQVTWDTPAGEQAAEGAPAEAWGEAQWPQAEGEAPMEESAESPKKKGWFGRSK